jgi:hypothetical protein
LESEERAPEETHPDEPGGNGETPTETDVQDESEAEEPLPGEAPTPQETEEAAPGDVPAPQEGATPPEERNPQRQP